MAYNITFIGLGVMGYPMAGHLARAGYNITVFNRSYSKTEQWQKEYNGQISRSLLEAVSEAQVVILCVGRDLDVQEIMLGRVEGDERVNEGILSAIKPGTLVIDHTTTSAEIARSISHECSKYQVDFLDAPVSGGEQGARQGTLTIMCGGALCAFDQAREIMNAYSKKSVLMGESGSGQLTKMVNQICVAGVIEGLAEGMSFAENAGLDVKKVMDVISQGAASSWQMVNRHQTMIDKVYNHGFAVDLMRKDLAICLEEAARNQSYLPGTKLIDQLYEEIQKMGGGRWDTSSLIEQFRQRK